MTDFYDCLGGPAASLVNATIVGIVICVVLVSNRMFWRAKTLVGFDDYLILLSLCLLIALGAISLGAVNYGYGRTQEELTPEQVRKALLLFFLYQIVYKVTITTTKLSVISLYLRIFREKSWFRVTCMLTAAVITCYTFAAVLTNIFECQPVSWAWDHTSPPITTSTANHNTCINITAFWLTTAIVNLTTELIILSASIFVVAKLELPLRQKIALVAILGLGIFVFITSILRVTTLRSSGAGAGARNNTTASTYRSTLWSTIEASTAIACACLPMLRAPIQRFIPTIFGSLRGSVRSGKHSDKDRHRLTVSAASPGTDHSPMKSQTGTPRSISSRGSENNIDIENDTDTGVKPDAASTQMDHHHHHHHHHSTSPIVAAVETIKIPKRAHIKRDPQTLYFTSPSNVRVRGKGGSDCVSMNYTSVGSSCNKGAGIGMNPYVARGITYPPMHIPS